MRRSVPVIVSIFLLAGLAGPVHAGVGADDGAPVNVVPVSADLDGASIAIEMIPDFFCHDRDYPRIHCFSSARLLELALAVEASGPMAATAATDYVQISDGISNSGAYMYLSQNYDTLFTIGWNDRIRSYRALNSARGVFWTDWFATGADLTFCCNVVRSSLPAAFDRTITSVYRR